MHNKNAPIIPSHDLFGLIITQNLFFPKRDPKKRAPLSA